MYQQAIATGDDGFRVSKEDALKSFVKEVEEDGLMMEEEEIVSISDSAYFHRRNDDVNEKTNQHLTKEQHDYFLSSSSNTNDNVDYRCQPRHVHLSLGNQNQQNQERERASMTISFSIPSHEKKNGNGMDETTCTSTTSTNDEKDSSLHFCQCNPESLTVSVLYQRVQNSDIGGNVQQTFFVIDNDHYHDTTIDQQTIMDAVPSSISSSALSTSVINQYTLKSPLTKETYTSDYIYHIQLSDLEIDSTYTYSIKVEPNHFHPTKQPKTKKNQHRTSSSTTTHLRGWTKTLASKLFYNTNSLTNTERTLYHGLRIKQKIVQKMNQSSSSDKRHIHEKKDLLGNTPKFTFRTPPSTNASTSSSSTASPIVKPTKFAIVGDLGQTYNSSITMSNILTETKLKQPYSSSSKITSSSTTTTPTPTPASLLIIAGDMSYANTIDSQWDSWFTLIEPITSSIPLVVAPGNHEVECDVLSKKPFLPYENRFYMPNRLGDAEVGLVDESWYHRKWGCAAPSQFQIKYDYGNAYYSFVYGQIKTIVLSSYSETRVGSIQYKWLEDELENRVDRDVTPWVIVIMHTQFYTTFKGHDDEFQTIGMRNAMEPLFYKYGVNVVFSGHDHAYMRSKPMYNWKVDDNGPVYLIVGEGGNREHHVKEYLHEVAEDWVDVRDKTVYGFGTLEVVNQTSANWKWIMDPTNDDEISFTDDVWLSNHYS